MSIKAAFFCLLALFVGLAAGLMINLQVVGGALRAQNSPINIPQQNQTVNDTTQGTVTPTPPAGGTDTDSSELVSTDSSNEDLINLSYEVLRVIRAQNYAALSDYVHPQQGVTFTPYSTVDRESDRTFLPDEIAGAHRNTTLYIWGMTSGDASPIQLTISQYFSNYVYNVDFCSAPMVGVNNTISAGNSLENVSTAYADASFVEFYFPKLTTENRGMDWCGLKLVFDLYEGEYKLVGIIHSSWTP